jgi:hypothetical protein
MGAPSLIIGRRTRKNNHNVYILGAGFSVDAGLPTIANFLNQMRDAADWLANEHRDDGRAAVERVLEFRHSAAAAGYRVNIDLDNIEDLFSLAAARPGESLSRDMQVAIAATLDHAQTFGTPFETRLRIADHDGWPISAEWRASANRIQPVAGAEAQQDVFCSVYDFFAALLSGRCSQADTDGQNVVVTFNYDQLLEDSLLRLGIPFSYGIDSRVVEVDGSFRGSLTNAPRALTIFKLHGSINWSLTDNNRIRVFGRICYSSPAHVYIDECRRSSPVSA